MIYEFLYERIMEKITAQHEDFARNLVCDLKKEKKFVKSE